MLEKWHDPKQLAKLFANKFVFQSMFCHL